MPAPFFEKSAKRPFYGGQRSVSMKKPRLSPDEDSPGSGWRYQAKNSGRQGDCRMPPKLLLPQKCLGMLSRALRAQLLRSASDVPNAAESRPGKAGECQSERLAPGNLSSPLALRALGSPARHEDFLENLRTWPNHTE
jgi:hypothetical protein